ncbi:MAG TPA: DNA polymerase III subunit beta, partial [Blastocatellia bacterium]|nr:DNA polymerase III subunit beta [Blastocatellia bacterium]
SNCPVEEQGEEIRAIIPRKALSELQKLAAATPDSVAEFSKDENHLFFKIGSRRLTSRMLTGQFPNQDLVIPKNNDKMLKCGLDKISQAIRRAALMADERSRGVTLEFEDGAVTITSKTADLGESREVVQVDYNSEKVAVRLNASYLLEFFGVVDTENILFEIKDDQTPVLIRPDEGSKYKYKYIVMPMRL